MNHCAWSLCHILELKEFPPSQEHCEWHLWWTACSECHLMAKPCFFLIQLPTKRNEAIPGFITVFLTRKVSCLICKCSFALEGVSSVLHSHQSDKVDWSTLDLHSSGCIWGTHCGTQWGSVGQGLNWGGGHPTHPERMGLGDPSELQITSRQKGDSSKLLRTRGLWISKDTSKSTFVD